MQALQLTKVDASAPSIELITTPKPIPGPGQVLVQVKASPIQPSDVLNSKGLFPHTTFPRIPGRDFAGIIVDGPSHFLGKEVFGTSGHDFSFTQNGCHAEYCLVSEKAVVEKPKNLSFAQAAAAGTPFTTAEIALRRAGVKAGETILVLGATGQVGSAVANLAKLWGCKVLGVGRGNAAEIDSAADPTLSKAKELTGGKGPEVEEMAQELKGMCEGFESGALVPMKESAMTFVSLQEAIEGYADGKKRYVIRFD